MPRYFADALPPGRRLYVIDLLRNCHLENVLAVNTDEGWVEVLSNGGARLRMHGRYEAHVRDKEDDQPRAPAPTAHFTRRGRW